MDIKAVPFKQRILKETNQVEIKDIKSIFEQNNYTNKYLQTIEEYLVTNPQNSQTKFSKIVSSSSSTFFPQNPLFKPYEMHSKILKDLQPFQPVQQPKPLIEFEQRLAKIEASFQNLPKPQFEVGSGSVSVHQSKSNAQAPATFEHSACTLDKQFESDSNSLDSLIESPKLAKLKFPK